MKRFTPRSYRRAWILSGLAAAALGSGMAATAGAQPTKNGIAATFASGTLTVTGDDLPNSITISRDAAGAIFVNGGAVPVAGGTPTVANTTSIVIDARGSNDQIAFNEANGALPGATIDGGSGNDTLSGGAGADAIDGGPGTDTLDGGDGTDSGRNGETNLNIP